jgi:hypothetical protein
MYGGRVLCERERRSSNYAGDLAGAEDALNLRKHELVEDEKHVGIYGLAGTLVWQSLQMI